MPQKRPHQTLSFEQLVGKANQEALKPFILQVFAQLSNDLHTRVMAKLAVMHNRLEATERILEKRFGITVDDILGELFDLEDSLTGHCKVDRLAQEGDFLRLKLSTKMTGQDFGPQINKELSNLGLPPYKMGPAFIERALLGHSAGETVTVDFDEDLKKATGTEAIRFVIVRISEKIVVPEPEKGEVPNAENSDAAQPSGSPEAGQAEQA